MKEAEDIRTWWNAVIALGQSSEPSRLRDHAQRWSDLCDRLIDRNRELERQLAIEREGRRKG